SSERLFSMAVTSTRVSFWRGAVVMMDLVRRSSLVVGRAAARRPTTNDPRRTSRPPPLAPVPLDQPIGLLRPPGAGRIELRAARVGGPGREQRIEPGPGRLHLVAAGEEGGVAEHRLQEQPLVG